METLELSGQKVADELTKEGAPNSDHSVSSPAVAAFITELQGVFSLLRSTEKARLQDREGMTCGRHGWSPSLP